MAATGTSQRLNAAGQPVREGKEPEVYQDRWELEWGAGLPRGQRWDCAAPSPALMQLLKSGKVDVKGKRVIVPGCGRGYDLPVFRAAGAVQVVGLELSPSAAKEAEGYLAEVTTTPEDAAVTQMVVGDFFQWSDPQGPFDVGFDYTFGCAMQPGMRQDWATHWTRALKPGGVLVSLVFPVNPTADPNQGPPFPISPDLFRSLLEPRGFEVLSEEPVPAELSHPSRGGKEILMVWRKK